MEKSQIYKPLKKEQRQSKALNTWLIVTNWMTYLKTVHVDDEEITRDSIRHGVFMVLDYIMPYLQDDKVEQVMKLQESYRFDGIKPQTTREKTAIADESAC